MRITDLISESNIRVGLTAKTKQELILELIDVLPLSPDSKRETVRAVMEREKLLSTGIGDGIAIPHGIAPVPGEVVAALGITAAPVDFDAIDERPVRLVFLLVANEAHHDHHMRALARISRLLHREGFRQALLDSTSTSEAMNAIHSEEALHRI